MVDDKRPDNDFGGTGVGWPADVRQVTQSRNSADLSVALSSGDISRHDAVIEFGEIHNMRFYGYAGQAMDALFANDEDTFTRIVELDKNHKSAPVSCGYYPSAPIGPGYQIMAKGDATLALYASNQMTGGSVYCWCEGGDATEDMFVVPDHLADEAQRLVDKRMAEIAEAGARARGEIPALG